jgi:hypothetical protein
VLVMGLVKVGTDSFNRAEPAIPVRFSIPWPVVLLLAIGVPAPGGGARGARRSPGVAGKPTGLIRSRGSDDLLDVGEFGMQLVARNHVGVSPPQTIRKARVIL